MILANPNNRQLYSKALVLELMHVGPPLPCLFASPILPVCLNYLPPLSASPILQHLGELRGTAIRNSQPLRLDADVDLCVCVCVCVCVCARVCVYVCVCVHGV